jgi:CW-type Zinc Finger
VAQQAIYRLYRYGQTKPVFCYSLLTQGTTEEKVYGRCVNKMGVAFRVIDKKTIERCFTESELEDLLRNLIWVQCAKCEKWRVLVNEISEQNVPEEWDCSMNIADKYNNSCSASEKSQAWYEMKYYSNEPNPTLMELSSKESSQQSQSDTPDGKMHGTDTTDVQSERTPNGKKVVDDETAKLVDNDDVLKHLLDVTAIGKKQKLICDYYFHDTIMETTQSSDEIEKIRRTLNPL